MRRPAWPFGITVTGQQTNKHEMGAWCACCAERRSALWQAFSRLNCLRYSHIVCGGAFGPRNINRSSRETAAAFMFFEPACGRGAGSTCGLSADCRSDPAGAHASVRSQWHGLPPAAQQPRGRLTQEVDVCTWACPEEMAPGWDCFYRYGLPAGLRTTAAMTERGC